MHFLQALVFLLFLTQVLPAQQPTPIVPDPELTPGDTFDVTGEDLCLSGYAKKVRNVPEELKREVYREYGITSHVSGDYEVDHLISLELGGSNSIKNLWPESHLTSPWNAQVKDRLENRLHKMVTMAVNQKLTRVLKDRVVQNFQLNPPELLISFADGSTMKVKVVEGNSAPLREGARIRLISEDQTKLVIACADDSTIDVTIADPGSSVAVRNKADKVEYLG